MPDIPSLPVEGLPPSVHQTLRRTIEELRKLMGQLEPMDAAITRRDLAANGWIAKDFAPARGRGLRPGDIALPNPQGGSGADGGLDLTPPPNVTGLDAVSTYNHVIVEWSVAAYLYGGGNFTTRIYAAKRAPSDAQATFADARNVFEATHPLTIAVLPSEVGIRWHVWAKFVSVDGVESASPVGGINGIVVTTGQVSGNTLIQDASIDSAKIVSLSVNKLIAGSIAVGAYIQSPNYLPNVSGWRIIGDGTAEFSNLVARGNITANSLSAASGTVGSLEVINHVRSGQTAYDTGTGFFLGRVGAEVVFSLGVAGGPSLKWRSGAPSDVLLTRPIMEPYGVVILTGAINVSVPSGNQYYAAASAQAIGGRAPYSYQWMIVPNNNTVVWLVGSSTGANAALAGFGNGFVVTGRLICIATDANGRVSINGVGFTATHALSATPHDGVGGGGGGESSGPG